MKNVINKLESVGYLDNAINGCTIKRDEINTILKVVKGRYFVYMLITKGIVLYVGKSRNLYLRLLSHKSSRWFTKILLIEYEVADYSEMEKQIIKLIQPKYNNCWVKYGNN